MDKRKVVCLLAMSAVFWTAAALAGTLPVGDRSPTLLKGTYGFNFVSHFQVNQAPGGGNGTLVLDGKGNVTGGAAHCNIEGIETDANVTGGKYSLNHDGSGYMTINTDHQFCYTGINGIDLKVSVVHRGAKFLFSSDASNNFYLTGYYMPATGEAERK